MPKVLCTELERPQGERLYGTLSDVKMNCSKAALPQTFAFAGGS